MPSILPLTLIASVLALGGDPPRKDTSPGLEEALRAIDPRVLTGEASGKLPAMLETHARKGLEEANRRETGSWRELRSREDWELFREARLAALKASLGLPPPRPPSDLRVRVTRTMEGQDHRIENLVFESRRGLAVTANLYVPAPAPGKSQPGILICHSHHAPKEEAELQEMGVSWARAGCLVLIMDQLGHGERRQHPFIGAQSYPRPFRAGRQDYYFRFNEGLELQVAGESLLGWMVWDLLRGVDLLLSRPGIDPDRIFLLGSVAGGGDPAAVAAALDQRIAAVVPFNFGGPQPETAFPLPPEAEEAFGYAGSGSWESTRNLRLSGRDGFFPWVIVGSVAPRRLLYAHEFSWDREHDPVWRRLEAIYGFYGARDRLAFAHGRGVLSGRPPEATHCTNIGPEHRAFIRDAFHRWFGIALPPRAAVERRSADDLRCLTGDARAMPGSKPLHQVLVELGRDRVEEARRALEPLSATARRAELRLRWTKLLGDGGPAEEPRPVQRRSEPLNGGTLERIALEPEAGIVVPLLLLLPPEGGRRRAPVVVAFSQEGKQAFLERRRGALAALLDGGAAVCLPDLRGTGETRPKDAERGRRGAATEIASTYLMLGRTLLGSRLRDLRSVLDFLRRDARLDGSRVALWGDSFAPANRSEGLEVPLDAEPFPHLAEPLGDAVALLGALFEDGVTAVYTRGGLESYLALLKSPFCYVPYDTIVPGALLAGDLPAVIGATPSGSVLREELVDGLNRGIPGSALADDAQIAVWILSKLAR